MSSPSICVHIGNEWSFNNCKFYFLTNKKKCHFSDSRFFGSLHVDFSSQEDRFNAIASWAISNIPPNAKVSIEGYAFAAKGVVFNIAENTGLLKHKLYIRNQNELSVVAPSAVKKYATGKGNADKMLMHRSFVEETEFDLSAAIPCNEGESPMSDIVDSYYIAKYTFHQS
jgi:Holliday junction resolvasome RuvABC endonuclease subunit